MCVFVNENAGHAKYITVEGVNFNMRGGEVVVVVHSKSCGLGARSIILSSTSVHVHLLCAHHQCSGMCIHHRGHKTTATSTSSSVPPIVSMCTILLHSLPP